ncbi:MAG: hypothetical protein Kow00106_15130 [Anaerolineae bacterium]
MTNSNARAVRALLLVGISLMLATLACYSGQIPGVFELTPYYTPTALPTVEGGKLAVLDNVLVPLEPGRPTFALTIYPEPLLPNAMNSKLSCLGDSTARVLYAGLGADGKTYYLINCSGSVGWAEESRLIGPLKFLREDLGIAQAPAGAQAVEMYDDRFRPMPPNPLQMCKPETIVTVLQVGSADANGDGAPEPFYQIDCPTPTGPVKGWVTGDSLFGPIEINIGDRAIALPDPAGGDAFVMASEPGPVTAETAVTGECRPGSILEAKETEVVNGVAYYRMTCGDIEGWVDDSRFVGPLRYEVDQLAVIVVPPILVFEDQLASIIAEYAGEAPAEEEAIAEEEPTTELVDTAERRVVEYVPPLLLADKPGPAIPQGEEANVVGRCENNTVARLLEFAAANDQVYYRIECSECVTTEVNEDGESVCTATELRQGWASQDFLEGPVPFVIGQHVVFKSSSKAIMTDEDGTKYARIPANLTGAASIGQYTEFSGRCPLEQGVDIIGVVAEQARTSSKYNFYYEVSCQGQPAQWQGEAPRREIVYQAGEPTLITGVVSVRDLEALPE